MCHNMVISKYAALNVNDVASNEGTGESKDICHRNPMQRQEISLGVHETSIEDRLVSE